MSPLFELSDTALAFVTIVGATTALFMAFLGIVQNDIKRVVAYSTLSQLGYMTVALGVSAYSAAIFHLMTHAFFKALLFLGAGSVIIALHHEQDLRKMGGLRKYMPITYFTAVVGSLAALGLPIVRLNALAGLGFAFTSDSAKARIVRPFARLLLGWLLKRPKTAVLVQNPDDYAVVAALGLRKEAIALIPGSGVDTDELVPLPEPLGPFTIAFVGRLLDDKGVRPLVQAHKLLNGRGLAVQMRLAGEPDPFNPASIPAPVLEEWRHIANLRLLGYVDDIRTVWEQAHAAVLPSRREGLPKSLLEAAACGRPLIATDVPGCREIAREGVNALLVPPDDPEALAKAIEMLMNDRDLCARFDVRPAEPAALNETNITHTTQRKRTRNG